jgi:hypothetical protein
MPNMQGRGYQGYTVRTAYRNLAEKTKESREAVDITCNIKHMQGCYVINKHSQATNVW